jgi:drug/metabolite transporter (DMT)-like permease
VGAGVRGAAHGGALRHGRHHGSALSCVRRGFGHRRVRAAGRRALANGGQAPAALGLSVLGFSGYYLLLAFGIQAAGTEVASSTPPTGPTGSAWLATILWNVASQRLSASLCGQLVVSETLFALVYSFAWDGRWPQAAEWVAALLFVLGILASIKAHR